MTIGKRIHLGLIVASLTAAVGCSAGEESSDTSQPDLPGTTSQAIASKLSADAAAPSLAASQAQQGGVIAVATSAGVTLNASSGASTTERLVAGEVLLKLRNSQHAVALNRGGTNAVQALGTPAAGALAGILARRGIMRGQLVLPEAGVEHLRRIVKLTQVPDVAGTVRELRALPDVEYAEPNRVASATFVPNDTYYASSGAWSQDYGDLWGLTKLATTTAWDISRGTGMVVAVIDTGLDYDHPDIQANLWQNPGEVGTDGSGNDRSTNGLDDDGNGFVDDYRGYDFVGLDNDPMDDFGHGTHVAGTIAAVSDNGLGVVGVAPEARIMALKGLDASGNGNLDGLIRAIYYAANNGAQVINASWGGFASTPIQALAEAVSYAHDIKGVVFVAAAGNSNADIGSESAGNYPGNLRDALTVGASDHLDQRASFSNFGVALDVAAPGGGDAGSFDYADRSILSLLSSQATADLTYSGALVVGGRYLRQAGTSMAAPHVAGLAALLRARFPELSAEQVRQAIRRGAVPVAGAGFNVYTGYGRANAEASLGFSAPLNVRLTGPTVAAVGGSVTVLGTASGPALSGWVLDYGFGQAPSSWTRVVSRVDAVSDATLATWQVATLPDGDYTLRLTATTAAGQSYEDRMLVPVDNLSITSPKSTNFRAAWHNGSPIEITGTVGSPSLANYTVRILDGATFAPVPANITLTNGGTQPVHNGVLATWNPAGLPANQYRIQLVATLTTGATSTEQERIVMDPAIRAGWPVQPDVLGSESGNVSIVYPSLDHFVARDVDGDRDLEIPVASNTQLALYHHTGALVAGWPQPINLTNPNDRAQYGAAIGDITGDGVPEVVQGTEGGMLYAFTASGSLLPNFPMAIPGGQPRQFSLSDVTGDGKAEIVVTVPYSLYVVSDTGAILPGFPVALQTGGGNWFSRVSVADLDHDGQAEIVVAEGGRRVRVLDGRGLEKAGWPRDIGTLDTTFLNHPALGDVDGDPELEIVISTVDGHVHVLNADGSVVPGWPRLLETTQLNDPAIGDIDGDGRAEIVVGTYTTRTATGERYNRLYALRSDGTAPSGWPVTVNLNSGSWQYFGFGAPTIADLDGDGRSDIVISQDSVTGFDRRQCLAAYRYDGTLLPGFPRSTPDVAPHNTDAAVVTDLDNNGLVDLVWGALYGGVAAYEFNAPVMASAPWPMFHHDAAHTGATEATAPAAPLAKLARSGWVVSASRSAANDPPSNATDGNAATRWSTGATQSNGQWFQIDLLAPRTFSQIRLDASGSADDYPRGYQVLVSNDGTSWGSAVASGVGTSGVTTINLAQQTARYVRIVQTGASTRWWSIHEIDVFGPAVSLSRSGFTASGTGSQVAANALDGNLTTRWSSGSRQVNGQFFRLDMGSARSVTGLTLDPGSSVNDYPRGYQVFASSDGTNWGSAIATGTGRAGLLTINFAQRTTRYLRIVQTGASTSWWSIHELNVLGPPPAPSKLNRSSWTATATGSGVTRNALDGNVTTRWSSGARQVNGQFFTLDMKAVRQFSQLVLDAATSTQDYPRGYQVFISNDGTNWGTAIASGAGTAPVVTIGFSQRSARYVRIVQTGAASSWWSIHELNVWQ